MRRLLVIALAAAAVAASNRAISAQEAPQAQPYGSICLMLESAARSHDLPVEFFARLIWQESRFRADAVGPTTRSGAQARGIAQFMPRTAADRSLLDPFDPIQALPKAAEFLRELHARFGNLGLAAAAYNAGPTRLSEWLAGTGSMPDETRRYVLAITGRAIEDWVGARQSDLPRTPLDCNRMIALLKETPSPFINSLSERVEGQAAQPWGVQLSAGFSRTQAIEKYAQAIKRLSGVVTDRDPIIHSAVLRSRGTRPFYRVRLGAESRFEADAICKRIRAAAGVCMVLRNT
jgi:hypothetical protein